MQAISPRWISGGVCAMLFCLPAGAQLSSQGGPIQIDADRSDVFEKENRVVFTGNVDVLQGNARLRADEISMFFEPASETETGSLGSGFGDPQRIEAAGDVFYVLPSQRARGDFGTYDAVTETITLTGNVVLSNGDNVARGECLTHLIEAERTTLGCGDERVTMVLNETVSANGPSDAQGVGEEADANTPGSVEN